MEEQSEFPIIVFEDTGNVHIDHCSRCHLYVCPFVLGFGCPIGQCPQCGTKMHECKVEEHVEEICPKTRIPCINSINGCSRIVRRCRLQMHLLTCPANIVVCTREWARKTVSDESKLQLKAMAKGVVPTVEVDSADLDLATAYSDQKVLYESYRFRRKHRVAQRDKTHRAHPLVPLRTVFDANGTEVMPGGHEIDGDTSEEEKEAKAAKMRAKKAVFKNCYLCQVDPASQHLHTLGCSESIKFQLGRAVKKWPRQEDHFHTAKNLMIDISPVTTSEDRHLLFRKSLYIRRCLKVFHIREIGDHELSQHQTGIDNVGQLCVRCPNWERGCDYHSSRLKPREGRLRFLEQLDSVVHCPRPDGLPGNCSLEQIPPWVFRKLAEYLPGSALYNLSMTSRYIRDVLFNMTEEHQLVDVKWKRTREGWVPDGLRYFFSTADKPVPMQWQPPVGLAEHLAVCAYGEKQKHPERRVLVLIDRG